MPDEPDRTEGGGRRGWRWTLLGGGVLALVVLVAAVSRPRAPSVQTAAVKRDSLVVPVQCDGTLEPPPGGELRAMDPATVAEILVKNGDRVAAGATLLRLENTELSRQAMDAKSEALRLEAERSSTAADLSELELEERHAARVFEGDARLLASGAITRQTYETDELALSRAREKTRSAKSHLASLEGDRPASSRLELARQSAADLERRVAALTVKAPADGQRLRPSAARGRSRHRRPGRGQRHRPRAPAAPGPRRPAGSAEDGDRPAPDGRLRRAAPRALGGPRHVRGSRAEGSRRPRGRRGPRRDRGPGGEAALQRLRGRRDHHGRKSRRPGRTAGECVSGRRDVASSTSSTTAGLAGAT